MVGNLNGRKSHSASLVSGLEHGRNAAKKKKKGDGKQGGRGLHPEKRHLNPNSIFHL